MLVGALQIEIRRPVLFGPMPAFEHESMSGAAIEPDVENVGDHLVIVGVAIAEEMGGIGQVPGVDAMTVNGLHDPAVDLPVDQQLARFLLDEQGDRDAPGPLAADHPVGTLLNHRAQAVATLLWHEAGAGDRIERQVAQRRAAIVLGRIHFAAFALPALLGAAQREN